MFIAFPLYIKANTEKLPINRHFIIVVDQTINSSNNNLSALYKGLSCWLQGKDPYNTLNVMPLLYRHLLILINKMMQSLFLHSVCRVMVIK